jgi:predicted nucleotidyltransferase
MNAEPILAKIAKTLQDCRLEVVLVGNAAAALQGAPVTTLDFDFLFRKTSTNLKKVRKVAEMLGMSFSQPYYPASDLYRLVQKESGLQIDFMSRLHGVKSFESLRSRAAEVKFGTAAICVADLKDIIRSKRALGRPKDLAVLDILEKTQDEKEKNSEE